MENNSGSSFDSLESLKTNICDYFGLKSFFVLEFNLKKILVLHSDAFKQRLEFLGDAALQIAATSYLFEKFILNEGQLTVLRQLIVSSISLIFLGKKIGLLKYFDEHYPEVVNTKVKNIWLEETLESLFGDLFLNVLPTNNFLKKTSIFFDKLILYILLDVKKIDIITVFQKFCQSKTKTIPEYSLLHKNVKNHLFGVKLTYKKYCCEGYGTNIKFAKIEATIRMCKKVKIDIWKNFYDNLFIF